MTIGFDASRAFSKDRTGTENYSYQLLKALAKIDQKNQYIIYLRTQVFDPEAQTRRGETLQSWPSNFQFKVINWSRLWTQGGLARQTFKDNLDVLFIPAHTSPLIHKPGLKTVVTVHDLGAEYLPKMHQIKQRLYLKWITHYQLKHATKLIAVSKATKEDLIKKVGIDPNKIEVIYEGYDNKLFKPDTKSNSKEYFLFVGTIQPRKNLERIIKAVSKLNQKLVIVGGNGWMSDEIYKLGQKEGVKFLGRVDDRALARLYRQAKAFLFPSLFEGFGLPILEAQASGCPVLTSNISSMPEVAGKGAVYVNPYDVDDIVRGMNRINNQDARDKLIRSGLKNVKRFSWEKCARETLEVLEKL